MKWQDDPDIRRQLHPRAVRNGLIRTAIIWTPLFLIAGSALLFLVGDKLLAGGGGTWFGIVVLAVVTALLGFQGGQAVLDLFTQPRQLSATVVNRWSRSDAFVFKSHYVRLDGGQILRADSFLLDGVRDGDRVQLTFYPHSAIVVHLEKLTAAGQSQSSLPN